MLRPIHLHSFRSSQFMNGVEFVHDEKRFDTNVVTIAVRQ